MTKRKYFKKVKNCLSCDFLESNDGYHCKFYNRKLDEFYIIQDLKSSNCDLDIIEIFKEETNDKEPKNN
jgi:hypothetical protein